MIETLYQVATTHGWALEVFSVSFGDSRCSLRCETNIRPHGNTSEPNK